jgi:sulfate/thiosulfate transport system permease protein
VLRGVKTYQEQAADTLGAAPFTTFRRITLPAIRWAVGYGVVLTTARAIGEFGAVSIVSGRIEGKTETLPLYVQSQFDNSLGVNPTGAFAASVVLALIALVTVLAMRLFRPNDEASLAIPPRGRGGFAGAAVSSPLIVRARSARRQRWKETA